jgi:parvulin-like peptidyl-prolyl isomerase
MTLDDNLQISTFKLDPSQPVAKSQQKLPSISLESLSKANVLRQYIYHQVLAEVLDTTPIHEDTYAQLKKAYWQANGLANDEEELQLVQKLGLKPDDLRWQIELSYRVNQYCNEHFLAKAEARFLDRKNSLDQVIYSLIRVGDGALARELYHRILEGEANFADLARDFSEGAERNSSGIVGPAPLAKGHPQLTQRLRSAKPGDLIAPFQIEQWWVVVRLESYQPASLDDTTSNRMAQELFDEWIQAETTSRIAFLSSAAPKQGT